MNNDEFRKVSGDVGSDSKLAAVLYLLMRDEVFPGVHNVHHQKRIL